MDASEVDALVPQTDGAVALHSCAGPAYHRWSTDWPPLGAALIRAAEMSGAVLVSTGNRAGDRTFQVGRDSLVRL